MCRVLLEAICGVLCQKTVPLCTLALLLAFPLATGEAAPMQSQGKWGVTTYTSPIDDSTNVSLSLKAETPIQTSRGLSMPIFALRCKEKRVDVLIDFGVYLGIGAIDVLYRLDREKAEEETWAVSTNYQGVFVVYTFKDEVWTMLNQKDVAAKLFIRKLVHHEKLLVQLTPYGENPVMTTFDLRGLAAVIRPLVDGCLHPELLLSDTQIHEAQTLLNGLGYDSGTPDGKLGPKTRAAIKRFQTTHGSEATGKLSLELLEALWQTANRSR